MRSYVAQMSAFVRTIRVQTRGLQDKGSLTPRGRPAPSRASPARESHRGPAAAPSPDHGPDAGCTPGHLGAAHRTGPHAHLVGAVLRAAQKVFATAELAPLRRGLAIDLDEVQGEID